MQISEPAEYIILGLLKSKPMHGYEMFQHFQGSTLGEIVHIEMSQLYAFLKKLERMTYVEAELEPQGMRPPRKTFHITEDGQSVFFNWLREPVAKPRDIRILFLIKLYFVQRHLSAQTGNLIAQQISACQHFLERLEAKHASVTAQTHNDAFFDHVVLRSRIHQTHSLLEWLHELQAELAIIH
jgi:PadR family transcriptional regulator, regulatory protein AphA